MAGGSGTRWSGQRGGNGRAAYGSAKAGLELLTKVMAVELAPYNINVNNIAPGAIETEMAKFCPRCGDPLGVQLSDPHGALWFARGNRRCGRFSLFR